MIKTPTTPNINSRSDFSSAKIPFRPYSQDKTSKNSANKIDDSVNSRSSAAGVDSQTQVNNFSQKYQAAIEWIGSKESVFVGLKDFLGDELPTILAQGTRNFYSFSEAVFQAGINVASIFLFPATTSLIGKFLGRFFLDSSEHEHYRHYMLFNLKDLKDQDSFLNAKNRIKEEEIGDSYFMENVFGKTDRNVNQRNKKISSINSFLERVDCADDKLLRLKNFKKAVIFLQGTLESSTWGSLYLLNRLFRKYILGQDRFTGTVGYASKKDSDKIGDSEPLSLWQKLGFVSAILSGPAINLLALIGMENKSFMQNNPKIKEFLDNWDMSHGVFPKLNLMFSYCLVPQFISAIAGSQGRNELIENLMSTAASTLSWAIGLQATNGRLARNADKELAEKFHVDQGILIDKKDIHSVLPNPLSVHEIIDKTKNNPALQTQARSDYAKAFSRGFFLNSAISFVLQILINQITRWRVQSQIALAK